MTFVVVVVVVVVVVDGTNNYLYLTFVILYLYNSMYSFPIDT